MSRFQPPMPKPMPPGRSLARKVREGLRSALGVFQAGAFTTGGVGRHSVRVLPRLKRQWHYTVREPDLIKEILVDRAAAFPKSVLMDDMLRSLIGSSIFIANGETWRWRRAVVDQALQQARVGTVFARMRDAADATLARIERAAGEGPVAIDAEMTHFAADVIFRTLFSEPVADGDAPRIIAAFDRFQAVAYAHGMLRLARLPVWLLPGHFRKLQAARDLRAVLKAPLDRRLAALREGRPANDDDIAAVLIGAADPRTGRRFSDADLLDEIAMLFLAGHETSASALAWTLYLAASCPHIQERMYAEAHGILGERAPEFGDIKKLSFIRDVFREALRLYPPVAAIARDATCPEQMGDRDIAPGSILYVSPWVMHRQDRFWDDPNAFDPDRFETEGGRQATRQAYLPFSMGPRVCPGAAFALQEATLALAMLVLRFRFDCPPGHTPEPIARLTLRSANGLPLVVRRRRTGDHA